MLDIQEILKKVSLIEIKTRKVVNELLAGEYHSTFKGQGVEFMDVRPYQPGDDFRTIDWNVTSRHDELFVKQFHEEREQTLLFAVDVSGSLRFGTTGRLKSEVLAEVVALLAFAAVRNGDRAGLLLFSDQVELFIPPRKGREHVLRLIREIIYFEPKGRGTDFDGALAALSSLFPRKATVFLCSDFLSLPGRTLTVMARRHDVTAISVADPAEQELPASGWIEWMDPETGRNGWADTSSPALRARYKAVRSKQQAMVLQHLRRSGVDVIPLDTATDVVRPLMAFFRRRERGRVA